MATLNATPRKEPFEIGKRYDPWRHAPAETPRDQDSLSRRSDPTQKMPSRKHRSAVRAAARSKRPQQKVWSRRGKRRNSDCATSIPSSPKSLRESFHAPNRVFRRRPGKFAIHKLPLVPEARLRPRAALRGAGGDENIEHCSKSLKISSIRLAENFTCTILQFLETRTGGTGEPRARGRPPLRDGENGAAHGRLSPRRIGESPA